MTTNVPSIIGCVAGTRSEIIKMAPILLKLKQCPWAKVLLISTAHSASELQEAFELFSLKPDFSFDATLTEHAWGHFTGSLLYELEKIINAQGFDVLLACGDTTTTLATALTAFYHHIPFGHIEAGLRTHNIKEPFPEEVNRKLIAPLATWHFVPTELEKTNLIQDHVPACKITITGNPTIDALYWVLKHKPGEHQESKKWSDVVVVTVHRRENFGENIKNICHAVLELSEQMQHLSFAVPMHANPQVQKQMRQLLDEKPRIHLLSSLRYDEFAHLLKRCVLVLTDSEGIQVEAPALKKPVVILRNVTERPALISQELGLLVGTDKDQIVAMVRELLTNKTVYNKMTKGTSHYGDGHAAKRIVASLKNSLIELRGM